MNEPSESKCPEQIGKEISDRSQSEPKGIDGSQKIIKVSEGNLKEKNEDDSSGNENGEDKSF